MKKQKKILMLSIFLFCFLFLPQTTLAEITLPEISGDIKPEPKIEIPGLQFSNVAETERAGFGGQINTYKVVPYLAEYIGAIYRYATIVVSILAVVVIIMSGFNWAISGGDMEKIKQAHKRIGGAILGLLIAVSSYTILHTININLVAFKPLEIMYIQGINLSDVINSDTPGDAADIEALTKAKASNKVSLFLPDIYQIIIKYLFPKPAIAVTEKSDGRCWGYNKPSQILFNNEARQGALAMAKHLKNSKIVSYAYSGGGVLNTKCSDPRKYTNNEELKRIICAPGQEQVGGYFKCVDGNLGKKIDAGQKIVLPWDLDYCLDCSNFIKKVYACGANKDVAGGTEKLFGCEPETLLMYQPIPRDLAQPGDIVGYRQNINLGIQVGHAMLCVDEGCTTVLHVHGPQASQKQYVKKGLDYGNSEYLARLLQSHLEKIRSKNNEKYAWSITISEEDRIALDEVQMEEFITLRESLDKIGKNVSPLIAKPPVAPYYAGYGKQIQLPEDSIKDMEEQTGWKFEYRKIRTIEYTYSGINNLYPLLAQTPADCNLIQNNTVCPKSAIAKMKAKGYCK